MLVFSKKKVVKRKVTINVPNDGEGYSKAEIMVTWDISRGASKNLASLDAAFFQDVISNVGDVVDEETKQPIEFNKEWLEGFLMHDYVVAGLQAEYIRCTIGANRGN